MIGASIEDEIGLIATLFEDDAASLDVEDLGDSEMGFQYDISHGGCMGVLYRTTWPRWVALLIVSSRWLLQCLRALPLRWAAKEPSNAEG